MEILEEIENELNNLESSDEKSKCNGYSSLIYRFNNIEKNESNSLDVEKLKEKLDSAVIDFYYYYLNNLVDNKIENLETANWKTINNYVNFEHQNNIHNVITYLNNNDKNVDNNQVEKVFIKKCIQFIKISIVAPKGNFFDALATYDYVRMAFDFFKILFNKLKQYPDYLNKINEEYQDLKPLGLRIAVELDKINIYEPEIRDFLEQIIKDNTQFSDNFDFHYVLGKCYLADKKEQEKARKYFVDSLSYKIDDDKKSDVLYNLALIDEDFSKENKTIEQKINAPYPYKGNFESAIKYYEESTKLNLLNKDAWFALGRCYSETKKITDATASFKVAAKLGHSLATSKLNELEQIEGIKSAFDKSTKEHLIEEHKREKMWFWISLVITGLCFVGLCAIAFWNLFGESVFEDGKFLWGVISTRLFATLSCIAFITVFMRQMTRARAKMNDMAKELQEYAYIETLLIAKTKLPIDSVSQETNEYINKMIDKHLDKQTNLVSNQLPEEILPNNAFSEIGKLFISLGDNHSDKKKEDKKEDKKE